jgi:hypothetical protein
MLEFIQGIGTFNLLIIVLIFIVFLVMVKKVIKTAINMVLIAVGSIMFPVMLHLLGFSVPFNLDTILFFLMLGLGLYFLYLLGKIIYSMLSVVEKSAKVVTYPFRDKDKGLEKKVKKIMEEKEKEKD